MRRSGAGRPSRRFTMFIWAMGAIALIFLVASTISVFAQSPIKAFPPGTFSNKAALDPPASSGYQGPGDVVSGATAWGSCARAYNGAYANGTNSLCDLKDATTGAVSICTLRVLTTGFVDLAGSYCTGSTTPSLACAAAAGGACIVSKVYDQTGNGNHLINATAAQMPALTFSAQNGLPGLTFTSSAGAVKFIATGNLTISQPFSFSTVAKRTANNTTAQNVVGNSTTPYLGFFTSTNTIVIQGTSGSATLGSQADGSFHGMQGIVNGASSFVSSDGTDSSTGTLTGTFSAAPFRFGRGPQADAVIMEGGLWSAALTSGQAQAITTNQRSSTNGYNF